MDTRAAAGDPERFVSAHVRRNFVALALDLGFFGLGMSFASTSTILPALAERLGAPNLIIGCFPSLFVLGRALPAVFSARVIESLPRKLPFVLTYTLWERLPWLALAAAVFALAESSPEVVLALLVGTVVMVSLVGGSLGPAWMDLVGKLIPTLYRGRFFAVAGAFATGLGLLGAVASGYFLRYHQFPAGYALCLTATFLCLMASFASMAAVREPAVGSSGPPVPFRVHLARLPRILRANPPFAWFLVAQALRVLGMMGAGFYTVNALRFLGAEEWNVASFTFALLGAQAAGGLALGVLADRQGHRASLLLGVCSIGGASLLALVSGDLLLYHGVFLLLGVGMAATSVSAQNLVLELAGRAERPTYVGLTSTAQAPFALLAPLVAAVLADGIGLRAVFAAAALLSAASAAIYLMKVAEPRRLSSTG